MSSTNAANRYGSIAAEIYDIDKPFGALPDTAFYLERLADIGGPILEPACGSGRALVPLAKAGHAMVGFDPSAEMLAQAEARLAESGCQADLSRQRYEDFQYEQRFAALIVPVGSFTLIDRFEVATAVLRRFCEALRPGGLAMIDIQPLALLANMRDDRRRWTAPNGDLLTVEGIRLKTDWLRQRSEYQIRYERWRDHQLIESQLEPMVQRYWGLEEFRLALAAAGFAEIAVYGSYDRTRSVRSSDYNVTFEAIRPCG